LDRGGTKRENGFNAKIYVPKEEEEKEPCPGAGRPYWKKRGNHGEVKKKKQIRSVGPEKGLLTSFKIEKKGN